ncbi:unnamed protein product, partial [Mesorhabditis belari]|uniref:Arf-GAP domain-containing protein n=1 Tax=Mesorhabditis belari TaxID=2138241 RepID=A0AAF3F5H7_9BILA
MANTATTSTAAKKKQDERNSKIIRELANLPDNRFCFECGQRGPTYVNITEGSFCCSTCSGLLRGLNPPHRVKSISMATFSNEELEKIRTLGNAENKKTWLGLYEGAAPKFATRDERQTFLIKKYEKKAWFVSRSELNEQERLFTAARERSSQCSTSVTSESSQQTNDLLNDPFSDAFAFTQTQGTNLSVPLSPPSQLAPPPPLFSTSPSNSFPMPTTTTPKTKPSLPINPQVSAFVDPFSPVETQKPIASTNPADPFADFDNLFGGLSVQKPPPTQMPRSQTVGGVSPRPAQVPILQQQPIVSQTRPDPTPSVPISQPSAVDKYSALAELDQIFSSGSPATTAPVNGHQHQQQPQQQQWSSSAYGSRPTNGGNPFGQATPVVAPIQQPNPAQAWPNPFQVVNPFGPTNGQVNPFASQIQKSSTVGAFGDLSSNSMNQQFTHQQQHFASNFQHSVGFVEGNPFASSFSNPQSSALQPNRLLSNSTTNTPNWNPFS